MPRSRGGRAGAGRGWREGGHLVRRRGLPVAVVGAVALLPLATPLSGGCGGAGLHLVLHGVDQFHVADGVGRLLDLAGDALVAFAAESDRPIDGGSAADFRFPLLADFGQIVGPNVGGAAAIGTVDHDDVGGRQFHARVGFHQFRIVPFRDLAEEDSRQSFRREVEIRADAGNVIDRNVGAHHGREVQDSKSVLVVELLELHVVHRAVAGSEIDGAFGHLLDAAAGTDGLVVELQDSETSCGIRQTTSSTSG